MAQMTADVAKPDKRPRGRPQRPNQRGIALDDEAIAAVLRALHQRGKTPRDLVEVAGRDQATIRRMLSGLPVYPETLRRVARAIDSWHIDYAIAALVDGTIDQGGR